jgi:hypothetical protein
MSKYLKILSLIVAPIIVLVSAYFITKAAPTNPAGVGSGVIAVYNNNIGIGTTSPASALTVVGGGVTSASSSLNITDSNGSSLLFVRDDGNIGIKNSSPAYNLDVNGSANIVSSLNVAGGITGALSAAYVSAGAFGSNTGGGTYSFPGQVAVNTSSVTTGGWFPPTFQVWGDGRFNSQTDANAYVDISSANGYGGLISLSGENGLGSSIINASGNTALLNNSGQPTFAVDQSGNSAVARNLAVGTTTTSTATLFVTNSSNPEIRIGNDTALRGRIGIVTNAGYINQGSLLNSLVIGNNAGALHLGTNSIVRMTVDTSGNVGIGTTTPRYTLDVNGIIRAQQGLIIPAVTADPSSPVNGQIWLRTDI